MGCGAYKSYACARSIALKQCLGACLFSCFDCAQFVFLFWLRKAQ
jgi:hypothetical protein